MKPFKIDLDSVSHLPWTVIINGKKYKTTRQAAFFISPVIRTFAEKHPTLNSCKVEIEGADEHENLISTIFKLRNSFNITLNNYEFIHNFCEAFHITIFDSQLSEFEEKVANVAKSVSTEPHIRILKLIERELLRISYDRINKIFEALSRAADMSKQEDSSEDKEVDFKPKKSSIRSPRSKKETSNSATSNLSNEDILSLPIVKSSLSVSSAIFGLCISQPQNIDMYVNLLSICSKETIREFKRKIFFSNFESQEVSFIARMMLHHGFITTEELKAYNKSMTNKMNTCSYGLNPYKSGLNAMKKGITFSMIDFLNESNGEENVKKSKDVGESFPTFFLDLATQKQIKNVSLKFESLNSKLNSLSNNNWELHQNLSFCGRNDQPLAIAIRKDDIDSVQKIVTDQSLKKDSTIKPSIYERFSLMNVFKGNDKEKDKENEGIKLIDFASFFGAVKCFKYFLLNGFEMSSMSFHYAICGGVSEIIHICEEKKCETKGSLFYAIRFHRHELFDWLIDTKSEAIENYDPLKIARDVVKYYNITSLVNLIQRGFDPSLFVIPAIENGNLLLLEYLATIQHLNFNAPIQLKKRKVFPLIVASAHGFNADMIKFLLKYCKCDINQEGKFGITSLHLSCLLNDEENVNFLMKSKNLNLMKKTILICLFFNDKELTSLHIACKIGSTNIVSTLLQNESVDINCEANVYLFFFILMIFFFFFI